MKKRRKFTGREPLEIVLEGLQSGASVADVCRKYEISTTIYYRWRHRLFERADSVFERQTEKRDRELEQCVPKPLTSRRWWRSLRQRISS